MADFIQVDLQFMKEFMEEYEYFIMELEFIDFDFEFVTD